jgi:hypothetical protein
MTANLLSLGLFGLRGRAEQPNSFPRPISVFGTKSKPFGVLTCFGITLGLVQALPHKSVKRQAIFRAAVLRRFPHGLRQGYESNRLPEKAGRSQVGSSWFLLVSISFLAEPGSRHCYEIIRLMGILRSQTVVTVIKFC